MADTTYFAKAVRFCRQYSAANLSARYASLPAAVEAARLLKAETWKYIPVDKQILLPPHSELAGTPDTLDCYDAYSICADHTGELHRAYAGMAAYRIALPDSFAGLALKSLSVRVASDPYNVYGARLALVTSASGAPLPSADWTTAREGTVHIDGIAPRTIDVLAYGAMATATFAVDGSTAIPSLGKYLWVYVSLENYEYKRNGWLEGSSILDPQFTLVTTEPAAGYADLSDIGGGYISNSIFISTNSMSAYPRAAKVQPATDTSTLRSRWREVQTIRSVISYVIGGAYPTAPNSIPYIYGILGQALGKQTVAPVAPYMAIDPAADGELAPVDFYGVAGWSPYQYGLSANIVRKAINGYQNLYLNLSHLVVNLSLDNSFLPRKLSIKHPTGAATLSLGGMRVRLTAWWCDSQIVGLFDSLALRTSPSFYTGESETVTGTITCNGTSPAYTKTVTAALLGSVSLTDTILEAATFQITFPKITFGRYGSLIIVPWIDGVDNGLTFTAPATEAQAGLGTIRDDTHTMIISGGYPTAGWHPDLTLT